MVERCRNVAEHKFRKALIEFDDHHLPKVISGFCLKRFIPSEKIEFPEPVFHSVVNQVVEKN